MKLFVFGFFVCTCFLLISSPANATLSEQEFKNLIRKTQENSQRTYDEINSVQFEGYLKSYVYVGMNAFDLKFVPMLEESYFNGFWQKPDSLNIIVKALRFVTPDDSSKAKFSELGPLPNPFQYMYDPAVLGMKKEGQKEKIWPLYPFSLKADSVYQYKFISEVGADENRVVEIRVEPKRANIPAVIGSFRIDKNRFEVVSSDVVFNDAASFTKGDVNKQKNRISLSVSGTEGHQIRTQKTLMYNQYWLPTAVEEEFELEIWGIKVKIQRQVTFETYFINPEVPDTSLKLTEKVIYQRDPELEKKVFKPTDHPNRLTRKEQEMLIKKIEDKFSSRELMTELIDSDNLAKEAYKIAVQQSVGKYLQLSERLGSFLHYNRVEGLKITYGHNFSNLLLKNSIFSLVGGYGFKDQRLKGQFGFLQYLGKKKQLFLEGNLYDKIDYAEGRRLITGARNTFTSLLYKGDYRDYYYKKGGNIGLGFRVTENLALKLAFVSQTEESAMIHSNFSIFNYKDRFRLNPEIAEGELRGLQSSLLFNMYKFDGKIAAEYTDKTHFASDFSYSVMRVDLEKQFRPSYHSKFFLNLSGGMADGYLPPQRWFDLGGKTFMNYHGNLRGVGYKAFTGDRMFSAVGEYSLNLMAIAETFSIDPDILKLLKLTFWGGFGRTELSEKSKTMAAGLNVPMTTTDGNYYEFGTGIGDFLNIFRLDFVTNNESDKKVLISFNMLR
jgi:hypothetical protein